MSVVQRLFLCAEIDSSLDALMGAYDIDDIKGDIQTATNYVIDFDGENIVWKENPTIEELEQAYNGIKELWDYKNGRE